MCLKLDHINVNLYRPLCHYTRLTVETTVALQSEIIVKHNHRYGSHHRPRIPRYDNFTYIF
jgi:hypothetical protein